MTSVAGRAALISALMSTMLMGCLFRTSETPRFYVPASTALDGARESEPTREIPAAISVRLGSIRSAPFLRERIVWRASPVEYGLYEQRRWFELPSRYLRRAVAAALQSTPGLRLSDEPTAPRLDLELLAFDEILAPAHEAHVAVVMTIRADTKPRLERAFAARVPIASADGAATAESMGRALDQVAREIATATIGALETTGSAAPRPHRAKKPR